MPALQWKECSDLNRTLSKLIQSYCKTDTASNILISVSCSYVFPEKGQLNDDGFIAELRLISLSFSQREEHTEVPEHMLNIHRKTFPRAEVSLIQCYSLSIAPLADAASIQLLRSFECFNVCSCFMKSV